MRSWQWPVDMIIEADPLTTTWEVTEELSVNHSVVVQHLKQIGKVKKLNKWVPCEQTKNKNCRFEVLSSFILCKNKPFLYWIVMCDEKRVLYDNQVSDWTKKKLQSISQTKLVPQSHGHCLVACCRSDPLQLSESWWNHYIWEIRSATGWDAPKTAMPAADIGQQKGLNSSMWQHPTVHRTTNISKVEQIGV